MSLELRCPKHPDYDGTVRPEGNSGVCRDCWEKYRRVHEPDVDPEWGHPTFPS